MYIARICRGKEWVHRIDDHVATVSSDDRERRRPQQPRAWKFEKSGGGAAAISQTIEGALGSARTTLAEPEPLRRRRLSETIEVLA